MRKIKIAQIGTSANSHGNMIFNSLKKQNDIFEIVGYCMPENEEEKFPEHVKIFEEYKKHKLLLFHEPNILKGKIGYKVLS